MVNEAAEQEESTEDIVPIEPQPKKRKIKKRKSIEKLGTRGTNLENVYPDEEIPSNPVTDPCDIQTSRNIISDDNSFNFSSEQTRRLYIHCREKWGSMGKAQMPSDGLPQPTFNESEKPSTPSMKSARSRWETVPSSLAKTPPKRCSGGLKKKSKNERSRSSCSRRPNRCCHRHLQPHQNQPEVAKGYCEFWAPWGPFYGPPLGARTLYPCARMVDARVWDLESSSLEWIWAPSLSHLFFIIIVLSSRAGLFVP